MQGAGLVLTSYQDSLRRAMDIVANNVANVNTTGYKRENIAFDTYLARPTPKDVFQFAVDNGTYRDPAQGPTLVTGGPLDLAIQGKGYFAIQTDAGVRYTRSGTFQLNGEGALVTPDGKQVLGDGNQPIVLPTDARDILVAADGTITAITGNSTAATQFGLLRPVKFTDEQGLLPIGDNLYAASETPEPDPESRVVQGSIEQSNVQSITEMTRMIEVSRAYQLVARLLETENQRQSDAIKRLGKIS